MVEGWSIVVGPMWYHIPLKIHADLYVGRLRKPVVNNCLHFGWPQVAISYWQQKKKVIIVMQRPKSYLHSLSSFKIKIQMEPFKRRGTLSIDSAGYLKWPLLLVWFSFPNEMRLHIYLYLLHLLTIFFIFYFLKEEFTYFLSRAC